MTINIRKATNIKAIGHHSNGNSKPVFCITTGVIYASATDAAKQNGTTVASISMVTTGKTKSCKGKRFCFVADVLDHIDEIAENLTARNAKVEAYDAIMAKQRAEREAKERLARHRAKCAELEAKLAKERQLLADAESICKDYN